MAVWTTIETFKRISLASKSIVTNYISQLGRSDLKKNLVVLTQDVTVEVNKEVDNRILWDSLSVGSASIKYKFIDNKVQYYVPLGEIKENDIVYDPVTRTVKIFAPKAAIDKDMVFVQSDSSLIIKEENGSWSPFGPRLKELSDGVMSEIKNAVLKEGNNQFIRRKAQSEAKVVLEEFFYKILGEFLQKEDLKLEIIMQ